MLLPVPLKTISISSKWISSRARSNQRISVSFVVLVVICMMSSLVIGSWYMISCPMIVALPFWVHVVFHMVCHMVCRMGWRMVSRIVSWMVPRVVFKMVFRMVCHMVFCMVFCIVFSIVFCMVFCMVFCIVCCVVSHIVFCMVCCVVSHMVFCMVWCIVSYMVCWIVSCTVLLGYLICHLVFNRVVSLFGIHIIEGDGSFQLIISQYDWWLQVYNCWELWMASMWNVGVSNIVIVGLLDVVTVGLFECILRCILVGRVVSALSCTVACCSISLSHSQSGCGVPRRHRECKHRGWMFMRW
jgi:hypothetical protein